MPRRPPRRPPQPGAPDETFDLLAALRFPLAGLPFIIGGLLWDWQGRNSQERNATDGPIGPVPDFLVPAGWFVGTIGTFRQIAFNAPPDILNLAQENPFDTGEGPGNSSGPFFPYRIRSLGTRNTGQGGNIPQEQWREGESGEEWEMLDDQGNQIGRLFNGVVVFGLRLPSGAYRWQYERSTIYLRDAQGFGQDFPLEPVLPQPFRLPAIPSLPLREAPGIRPDEGTVPDVSPDVPGEPVPTRRIAPTDAPEAPPAPGGLPAPARSPALPQIGASGQPGGQLATPLGQGGTSAQPLPVPTPRGQEFLPGGRPIPNSNPPATPGGMAQELGRIEGKLKLALDALPGTQGPNLLEEFLRDFLEDELRRIIRGLFDQVPGGSYRLDHPCPPGGLDVAPEPVVIEFPQSSDAFDAIRDRLDAIAELINAAKQMRQPTCRGGRGEGQPVTVLWEEV